jgi:hypothetical protein
MFPRFHWIIALLSLALPAVVQAQFTFTTNNGAITIIGYNGPGGAVAIPDTTNGYAVTGIGDYAFEDVTNLASIVIPGTVTNIGVAPFLNCTGLTNISVNATNLFYSSSKNVLFDKAQSILLAYPAGLTNSTFQIPFNVKSVGQYAFAYCPNLTIIALTNRAIGEFAFTHCTGLTSVTIGATNVGVAAFAFCTCLTNIVISVTNISIGGLAFAFCTNLTVASFSGNAPPDVGSAFYGDSDAVVYYLPGTTGWDATFGDAPTAEAPTPASEFSFREDNSSITIVEYLGPGGPVLIPASINGSAVTTLAPDAFSGAKITSVTIPNSVTNIGPLAFVECESLTNVSIPHSVTVIGVSAFQYCYGLTGIAIPGSVKSIDDSTFVYCFALTSVMIPSSVTNIGSAAFAGCTSLTSD